MFGFGYSNRKQSKVESKDLLMITTVMSNYGLGFDDANVQLNKMTILLSNYETWKEIFSWLLTIYR